MDNVDLDLIALIRQGAVSTYPLLACSVIVLAVALERAWALRGTLGSTARLTAAVVPLLARGDLRGAREAVERHRGCPARRVYAGVLGRDGTPDVADLERVAEQRQFEEAQGAAAYLWVLATIGSAAPFIGLFGTVLGIMRAFHSMAITGTGGFGVVAGGISEALIATALGLAVGIVSVALYNYFQARVERIDAGLRIGSGRVIEALVAARQAHGA
ncbi:MAG TPA: MotA/TolQ/ExbB proton channel family protein [Candidatus Binatia bacterium]|nr:MotA/TolQ/ExbB proton channel family protein [Candidatus Binatia bacterium]